VWVVLKEERAMTSWQLYWLTRCDYGQGFCIGVGVVLLVAGFTWILGAWMAHDINRTPFMWKPSLWLLGASLGFWMVACFIPTTKELAAILILPKIANSQDVQAIGQGVVDLAKEWLVELKPKAKD
jgi:hypothetical protein